MENGRTRTGRGEWHGGSRWSAGARAGCGSIRGRAGHEARDAQVLEVSSCLEVKREQLPRSPAPALDCGSLVEVRANTSSESAIFVLELGSSHRLQFSSAFDDCSLARLLAVLERR